MRALIATEYVTLDGVMEAPGESDYTIYQCGPAQPRNRGSVGEHGCDYCWPNQVGK